MQTGQPVKVSAEIQSGFLGMDQAHIDAAAQEMLKDCEEGLVSLNVKVFDVSSLFVFFCLCQPEPSVPVHARPCA